MRLGALGLGFGSDSQPYIAWHWRWSITWSWCLSAGAGRVHPLRPHVQLHRYNTGGQFYLGALKLRLIYSWQHTMRKREP